MELTLAVQFQYILLGITAAPDTHMQGAELQNAKTTFKGKF